MGLMLLGSPASRHTAELCFVGPLRVLLVVIRGASGTPMCCLGEDDTYTEGAGEHTTGSSSASGTALDLLAAQSQVGYKPSECLCSLCLSSCSPV